jgi:hypothetical protein
VPNVGLKPVAPQRVDGDTIEPKVSVPIVNGNSPATVADRQIKVFEETKNLVDVVDYIKSQYLAGL